jgi:hypothetical protein
VVDDARFRVPVPDGWDSLATDRADWADHATVALLASQRLDPQCASVASGESECTTPVASLRDGALLVWWRSTNCAGSGCELPSGDHLLVGGRQAVRLGGTHLCDELGATREDAYLVTVTPQRVDAIVACGRDASEALRTQLADMLERVAWRTP